MDIEAIPDVADDPPKKIRKPRTVKVVAPVEVVVGVPVEVIAPVPRVKRVPNEKTLLCLAAGRAKKKENETNRKASNERLAEEWAMKKAMNIVKREGYIKKENMGSEKIDENESEKDETVVIKKPKAKKIVYVSDSEEEVVYVRKKKIPVVPIVPVTQKRIILLS